LDCQENYCVPPQCVIDMQNGTKSGTETGDGCGGGICAPCPGGQGCVHDTDCLSNQCVAATTCNSPCPGQSDVNCGGLCQNRCKPQQFCFIPSDCDSQVCIGGKCQAPTSTDGLQNGTETGVDCGDPAGMCPPCPLQ
jgi:hypothetical protein